MSDRYDLHTHSTCSDGTTTPAAIAAEAASIGLAGFALTDHETIDGWQQARTAAAQCNIGFLPGIELNTRHGAHSPHLLGYGFDPHESNLAAETARVRESRRTRVREMALRLASDFAIDVEHILVSSEQHAVGRPHLADALVRAGYYHNRAAAFADALHPRSPYYVPDRSISTVDAIRLVRQAGGIPVLAHPAARRQHLPLDHSALKAFTTAGLWGIELDHPENRSDWLPPLAAFASAHGLRVTGASDYHGAGKPNRLGQCTTSAAIWHELLALVAVNR